MKWQQGMAVIRDLNRDQAARTFWDGPQKSRPYPANATPEKLTRLMTAGKRELSREKVGCHSSQHS